MRKFFLTALLLSLAAVGASGQSQSAPTLRVVTEDPALPSELFYGNTRVKPLRLRPGTNQPITIHDADFFVQQQYIDFLGRFPDTSGFQFWLNQITGCGTNSNCVDGQRTNTSGAFFLSIEFQETGFYAIRVQRAAFGHRSDTGAGTPANARLTYAQFTKDARVVGNGVIVGQPGYQQRIDQNKLTYAQQVVSGADFAARYPASQTAAQFVEALFASAQLSPTADEQTAAVNAFNAAGGGTAGRAAALRSVADSSTLRVAEKNTSFVLMQYFGYLRRDPDDEGYGFWLKKLLDHGGNFHSAEMVRSFLVSGEYIGRF